MFFDAPVRDCTGIGFGARVRQLYTVGAVTQQHNVAGHDEGVAAGADCAIAGLTLPSALPVDTLTAEQWHSFWRDGYLALGPVLDANELAALQQRIDEIMLGRAPVDYDRMMMQLDSTTGDIADAGPQTKGFKGATLGYRKIQDLELDTMFLACMRKELFRHICATVYGAEARIATFRAMFMNKPSEKGTPLAWHQDRWAELDRDPLITIWLALDDATIANGCVQVIPASHTALLNPDDTSGFLRADQTSAVLAANSPVFLEVAAGDAVLLHNWLLHASGVNSTPFARRAFSVCYMDALTQSNRGTQFPVVF